LKQLQNSNSKLLSSQTWDFVVWFINTNDSEEHVACVFSGKEAVNSGSRFYGKVSICHAT